MTFAWSFLLGLRRVRHPACTSFPFLEDFDIFWCHFEVSLNSVRYIPEGFSFYTDCRTFFDMISLGGGDWAFKFTTMVYHRV